jgi:hypothetical protein
VYFYAAGTSNPLTVYQDSAQTTPWTQPIVADAGGVYGPVFLPLDTAYKINITTSAGAALSGAGAPMMDVPTATLRQTVLARADIPAAVRAFMVVNQLGLLGVLAVAPMVFERIGPAMGVALCGGVITLQGVWTLARGRSSG